MKALSIYNLKKEYQGGVQALKGIDLQVEEGDLIIFPAHVLHMAPPHYDDKMRVIFSFNLI